MFDAVDEWFRSGPLDSYEATFDADLGYPTFLHIDGSEAADDEWIFSVLSSNPSIDL